MERRINIMVPIFAAAVAAAISGGCDRRPEGVISESDMVSIMADLQIAEAYSHSQYGMKPESPKYDELGEGILAAHGVTRAEFDSTLSWYGRNMDRYEKLYRKVDRDLQSRSRKIAKESDKETSADGAPRGDFWPYTRHFLMTGREASDVLSFSIPGPQFNPGSSIEWKLRIPSGDGLNMMLGVEYEDHTATYSFTTNQGRNLSELKVQTDTGRNVLRVFGMARPTGGHPASLRIDSISLIALPFDSMTYDRIRYQKKINL